MTTQHHELTDDMLRRIMPHCNASKRAEVLPILNRTAIHYGITNQRRLSAWLATLAQESGEFRYQMEIASGDAYDTRTDLGNTAARDGDGRLYKGHGRIQITGKTNHRLYTEYIRTSGIVPFVDFVQHPATLATEPYATDSAGWFFAVHINANQLADQRAFLEIQLRVNGGRSRTPPRPNHWAERLAYYNKGLEVIPADIFLSLDTPDELPDDGEPDFPANETVIAPQTGQASDASEGQDNQGGQGGEGTPAPIQNADLIANVGTGGDAHAEIQAANAVPPTETTLTTQTGFLSKVGGVITAILTGQYVIPTFMQGSLSWETVGNIIEAALHGIYQLRYWIIGVIVFITVMRKLESFLMKREQIRANTDPKRGNVTIAPEKPGFFASLFKRLGF